LVYSDLRRIARHRARFLAPDSSIQPTALVNEVYLKLVGADPLPGVIARTFLLLPRI
jgi:hypothetical protein